MIKLYLIGWTILLAAILLNGIISKVGVLGWYDFINLLIEKGSAVFGDLRLVDYVWLFVAYPVLLGLSYRAGEWLYNWLSGIGG